MAEQDAPVETGLKQVPGGFLRADPRINRAGRPKGARNKLGEDFVNALRDDFNVHGVQAIEKVRADRPHEYLKIIAGLLPQKTELTINEFDAMDERQLRAAISATLHDLAQFGIVIEGEFAAASSDQIGARGDKDQPLQALPKAD